MNNLELNLLALTLTPIITLIILRILPRTKWLTLLTLSHVKLLNCCYFGRFNVIRKLLLTMIFWVMITSGAHAKTYIRDYTYEASEADSKITSRTVALDQVKAILLQEIGTHIRQKIQITKDGSGKTYASEEIEAVTLGITMINIIEESWDGKQYILKAQIEVDENQILKELERYAENSYQREQQKDELNKTMSRLGQVRKENERLRKEIQEAHNSPTAAAQLSKEYTNNIDILSAELLYADAMNSNDFEEKFRLLTDASNKNHAKAQNELGILYSSGKKMILNYEEAVYWYRRSAEQGNSMAQLNLGNQYFHGHGTEKNISEAFIWWRKAAEQGEAPSQHNIGWAYNMGEGVEQDYKHAAKWYHKAALKGFRRSQLALGRLYKEGKGVPQSDELAEFWIEKSKIAYSGRGDEYNEFPAHQKKHLIFFD